MAKFLADYESAPLQIKDGKGCFLCDNLGRRYIDFVAGWCVGNIGWKRKEMEEVISEEAKRGVYVPPFLRYKKWEELARLLCENAPGKLRRAFRCVSGSEAVEFAIKCARAATGKKRIVSIRGVYHGHTYGAASVGNACTFEMGPCLENFVKLPIPTLKNFKEVIEQFESLARSGEVAAFLSEPVFSNAGVFIPPEMFYPKIQKICRRYNILLAMDEVATGFGRCGKLFASEIFGLEPDIICLGKGLTGGYAAAGATLVTEEVFKKSKGIPSYSTFGWVPQAAVAMLVNLQIILKERLWENSQKMGEYMLESLKELESLEAVSEVRGKGLLIAIEFSRPLSVKTILLCALRGLLVVETDDRTLFLSPPLILDKETADLGLAILKKIISHL